jgi:DNA polymerase bacteriophage-type
MPIIYFDFETCSDVDLTKEGARKYAADPSADIRCCAYAVDDGPIELWLPGDPVPTAFMNGAQDPGTAFVAHNAVFEHLIIQHVAAPRYGWPVIRLEQYRDTMAMALAAALPGGLEKVADALELENRKDTAGRDLMIAMSKPGGDWSEDQLQQYYEYCRRDVAAERELYGRLSPLIPTEQAVWVLDATINARGFYVDRALAEAAREMVWFEQAKIAAEVTELTEGEITSVHQRERILGFAQRNGHNMASLGKRNVSAVLAHKPDDTTGRLLELRREGAHGSTAKFDALLAGAGDDSRVRDTLRYHGSSTGRWSGRGFQPQNLPKTQADADAAVAAVMSGDIARVRTIGPPLAVASTVLRSTVCAAPGHKLIGGDFSAIENRVLAWLAGERWKLEAYSKFDATGDPTLEPYCATASRVLNRAVTDTAGRAIGKTCELAFQFGGGLGAYRKFDNSGTRSDAEVEAFKRQWRGAHPATRSFWKKMEYRAPRAIRSDRPIVISNNVGLAMEDGTLFITLPSGRRLAYPKARVGLGRFGDVIWYHDARGGWAETDAWYGTLVENVTQAVARDVLAAAMLRIEAAGYSIVLHVHDEVIAEVPEGFGSEAEFLKLMVELPPWAAGLPIAAKTWSGKRYAKGGGRAPQTSEAA